MMLKSHSSATCPRRPASQLFQIQDFLLPRLLPPATCHLPTVQPTMATIYYHIRGELLTMPQYCYFCTTITPYYLSSLSLISSHNNSQHSSKAQQVITSMIATERIALQYNDTKSPSSPLNTKNETHFSTENEGSADTWRKGAE